jgi:hypothetical protein
MAVAAPMLPGVAPATIATMPSSPLTPALLLHANANCVSG